MRKNGHHPNGRQRWYCPGCHVSDTTTYKSVVGKEKELDEFVGWLTDTIPLRAYTSRPKTFMRHHDWCWDIHPFWHYTGQCYEQVIIDGKHLPYNWCVLIARTPKHVLGYQFAGSENTAAYCALLSRFPAPDIVITDGAKGSLKAIQTLWPTSHLQRCLVHIQRNILHVTTHNPRLIQHRILKHLAHELLDITTPAQALEWIGKLELFNQKYEQWLNEKTYRNDVPIENIPTFARRNKKWWYTHTPTRSLVKALGKHVTQGTLFTFLEPTITTTSPRVRDTNILEGDTNKAIDQLLNAHRGLSEPHMLSMIDWYLYNHSENPKPPHTFLENPGTLLIPPKHPKRHQKPPKHINQQAPWEDGLRIHKGWIRN